MPSTTTTQAQLAAIAAGFSGSTEYATLYAGQSNTQIVNNLHLNLFGRAAEPAGLTHWAGRLTAGSETFASLALQLTYSAQGTDAAAIANKVSAANAFTAEINTVLEKAFYHGTVSAASARGWLATVTDSVASLATATSASTLAAAVAAATGFHTQAAAVFDATSAHVFTTDGVTDVGANDITLVGIDTIAGNHLTFA
ncbi:MAG: hypothetical protein A2063_11060 [Gallionellales bacterium GWA2_60_142]|nr:MAG: hypothetical protein A2063_11060 [Gallionellales bacterium GWA2_60_142]